MNIILIYLPNWNIKLCKGQCRENILWFRVNIRETLLIMTNHNYVSSNGVEFKQTMLNTQLTNIHQNIAESLSNY